LNGPKSREETPKEGSDTHQKCISHRSNIAPHRTNDKALICDLARRATIGSEKQQNRFQACGLGNFRHFLK
jgi:hypothetical protein